MKSFWSILVSARDPIEYWGDFKVSLMPIINLFYIVKMHTHFHCYFRTLAAQMGSDHKRWKLNKEYEKLPWPSSATHAMLLLPAVRPPPPLLLWGGAPACPLLQLPTWLAGDAHACRYHPDLSSVPVPLATTACVWSSARITLGQRSL